MQASAVVEADDVIGDVKTNRLWLVNGTISVLGEEVPSGFLNEQAVILAPPAPIPAIELLPAKLEQAWKDGDVAAKYL